MYSSDSILRNRREINEVDWSSFRSYQSIQLEKETFKTTNLLDVDATFYQLRVQREDDYFLYIQMKVGDHAHNSIQPSPWKTCLAVDPSIFPVTWFSSLPWEFFSFASSLERSTLFITWLCRGGVGESVSRASAMLLFETKS